MRIALKGMTWSHSRGYDPMVACAAVWKERTGIEITWDKRSLQDFETYPVEQLAKAYDLIVVDHPHMGQITAEKCLVALDVAGREAERQAMKAASVGESYSSYFWEGRQWAFPIDAATQVQAFRPDRLACAPATFEDVLDLAKAGEVLLPLRSPHALMTFFSLAANLGSPCATEPGRLIDEEAGGEAFERMRALVDHLDAASFAADPIAAFEAAARAEGRISSIPYAYGYVSYARAGFRERRLAFAGIPAAGSHGSAGGTLGGTGIAVSSRSPHVDEAVDFAYWLAGAEAQSGPYALSGGQPGHGSAWDSAEVNAPVDNFYLNTRRGLQTSYLRPRHDGYMAFQDKASERIVDALRGRWPAAAIIADLNAMFAESSTRARPSLER